MNDSAIVTGRLNKSQALLFQLTAVWRSDDWKSSPPTTDVGVSRYRSVFLFGKRSISNRCTTTSSHLRGRLTFDMIVGIIFDTRSRVPHTSSLAHWKMTTLRAFHYLHTTWPAMEVMKILGDKANCNSLYAACRTYLSNTLALGAAYLSKANCGFSLTSR